jgi:ATP-binding cassette subfamily B protein
MTRPTEQTRRLRRDGWRWYGGYLRRRVAMLALAVAPSLVVATLTLPTLWLIRFIFDVAIRHKDVSAILLAGAGILACRGAGSAVMLIGAARSMPVVRQVVAEMRADLVARLHRLPWIDLGALEGSLVSSRIVNDTERVEVMNHALVYAVLPALLPVVVSVALLVHVSWPMTVVVLIVTPFLRLASHLTATRLKQAIAAFQARYEQFNIGAQRVLTMLPVTRLQGTEAQDHAAHRVRADALGGAGAAMAFAGMANGQANGLVTGLVATVVLVFGGIAVSQGELSFGALAAFVATAAQVNAVVGALVGAFPVVLNGDEALIRLAELRAGLRQEEPGGEAPAPGAPAVTLEKVSFRYGVHTILDGQSMHIAPGQVTVVAAHNGAGKSTLLDLALGLHTPYAGRILVGGRDLALMDRGAWRRTIGVLPQHPKFFRGSMAENICFGRGDIDEQALGRAIHLAGLEAVLARLPGGLDAPMGDHGQMLSGGERQRVALARALVHGPRFLILDELSNHMDAPGLELIVQRLFNRDDRPTILMATHDPRLLALADQVYDLRGGVLTPRPSPALNLSTALNLSATPVSHSEDEPRAALRAAGS